MKRIVLIMMVFLAFNAHGQLFAAKTMKITTTPANAKIYIDGSLVGQDGNYLLKFGKNDEHFVVKIEAAGYLTKEVKLLKTDPRKSINYTLQINEADAESIGGDEASIVANKWVTVTVRGKLTEDQAWKRLVTAAQKSFDNIETRDKASGYLKTAWAVRTFNGIKVRTQLEIRADFSSDNLGYQVKLSSEIKFETQNNEGYQKYNRVLKKYENTINDIQNAVGGGE